MNGGNGPLGMLTLIFWWSSLDLEDGTRQPKWKYRGTQEISVAVCFEASCARLASIWVWRNSCAHSTIENLGRGE